MPNIVVAPGLEEKYRQEVQVEKAPHEAIVGTLPTVFVTSEMDAPPVDNTQKGQPTNSWLFGWKPIYWAYIAAGVGVLYVLFKK